MASSAIKKSLEIKKKSYTFDASTDATQNCFPLDLLTASTAVLGVKVTDRAGWNFIARNGVAGNEYSLYWALTVPNATLSGTYHIDVYYIEH